MVMCQANLVCMAGLKLELWFKLTCEDNTGPVNYSYSLQRVTCKCARRWPTQTAARMNQMTMRCCVTVKTPVTLWCCATCSSTAAGSNCVQDLMCCTCSPGVPHNFVDCFISSRNLQWLRQESNIDVSKIAFLPSGHLRLAPKVSQSL